VLSPAWTTDWMSDDRPRKLLEYGIAPPQAGAARRRAVRRAAVACPQLRFGKFTELFRIAARPSLQGAVRCKELREPF